ncbi:NrdH-redoxin [Ruania suaedae]|uniref:glutaredoxin domain-containing protein n=1 Tax=Ruania suaedae TaxID=2897774 RepID=UPI001E4ADD5E|nr:glutaredoxin domain-containing protein [Ruania suaedae]UFU03949.1 NrdH-redoxin [Ruania suaedae]
MSTVPEPGTVLVYTTAWCGYCASLKGRLRSAGIDLTEVDIEQTPAAVAEVERLNGGNRTVPTVIFPDGSSATNPSLAEVERRLAG